VTWCDPDSLYAAVVLSEADATASGYPREVKLWQRGQPFAQAHSLLKAEHRALAVSAWRMLNPDGGAPVDIIEEALSFYRTRYWRVLPDLSRQALPLPPKVDIDGVVAGQLIVRLNQAWGDLDAGVLLALDWQALCAGEIDPLPLFTPGPRQSVDGALAGRSCLFVHVLDEGSGSISPVHSACQSSASRWMARWPGAAACLCMCWTKASASCGYTPPPPTAGRRSARHYPARASWRWWTSRGRAMCCCLATMIFSPRPRCTGWTPTPA
jgi:prolyl oligopeptidase